MASSAVVVRTESCRQAVNAALPVRMASLSKSMLIGYHALVEGMAQISWKGSVRLSMMVGRPLLEKLSERAVQMSTSGLHIEEQNI